MPPLLLRPVRRAIGYLLVWTGCIAGTILIPAVWVWTIVLGYQFAGIFGGLVAFGTPVLSQIAFIFYQWHTYQQWDTVYNITLAVVAASAIMRLLGAWMIGEGDVEIDE